MVRYTKSIPYLWTYARSIAYNSIYISQVFDFRWFGGQISGSDLGCLQQRLGSGALLAVVRQDAGIACNLAALERVSTCSDDPRSMKVVTIKVGRHTCHRTPGFELATPWLVSKRNRSLQVFS